MKKLLLFILPMLLFFGISSGETYTFTGDTVNPNTAYNIQPTETASARFGFGISSPMELVSFITPNANGYACKNYSGNIYNLYKIDSNSSRTFIQSGMFTGFNGTTPIYVNALLSSGTYSVFFTVVATKSCAQKLNTYSSAYTSGFFAYFPSTETTTFGLYSMIFSGNYGLPAVTIRYDGTSTGFAGSNIYLNGNFGSYSFSGTDLVFNYLTNTFRILHRSH